jgi:hypothetical protein
VWRKTVGALMAVVDKCKTLSYDVGMTPVRKTVTFRIDDDLITGLQAVWTRDGIAVSEQIRRAIRAWLDSKDVSVKTERKRAVTRKRS